MITIQQRLNSKHPIILDAAMGTELQDRGIETLTPIWSANALLTDPDLVRSIHAEHIAAGAEIITTNTYRTARRSMSKEGMGERAHELTVLAVRLAMEAREQSAAGNVWIAGSMAPLEGSYSPEQVPPQEETVREHAEQAAWLADAGVDLILIETMNTVREAVAAVTAAKATGLPTLVGFTCGPDGAILSGEPIAEAAATLRPLEPDMILINCTPPEFIGDALRKLQDRSSLMTGAYGHLGHWEPAVGWEFFNETETVTPERYTEYAREWRQLGAQLIGGCCGTSTSYLEQYCQVQ